MDFGKIITIALLAFIGFVAFGDKIMNFYNHQNDLGFKLNNMVYTTQMFDSMDLQDKELLLADIETLCVRKHHADKINCTDTSYWLANSLTDEGVDNNLIMRWMPTCTNACETQEAPSPAMEMKEEKKTKSSAKYGGATKWFWEE